MCNNNNAFFGQKIKNCQTFEKRKITTLDPSHYKFIDKSFFSLTKEIINEVINFLI